MPHSVREIHATSHRTYPNQEFSAKNDPNDYRMMSFYRL